jgi:hypothetical protein
MQETIYDSVYNKIRKRYVDWEIEGSGQKSSDVRFAALELEMTLKWEPHRCPKLTVLRRHNEIGYQHDLNRLTYEMRECTLWWLCTPWRIGERHEARSGMPTRRRI